MTSTLCRPRSELTLCFSPVSDKSTYNTHSTEGGHEMDHFMIHIQRLVIFSSFGLPIPCGAVGEFAVNIAYGKPTAQSSTYIGIKEYGDTPGYPYNAALAVDGNTNTSFKNDGCSQTDLNSNSAWWEVDLLDLYNVLNITIYQRSDEINVAEKKLAKQSSMYNDESTSFSASLAVDGNTNTHFAAKSCSCTNPGDLNPWWSVDLEAVYFVIGIRIYQRMDWQTKRLKGFTLVGVHANGSNETIQTSQPYQTGEILIRIAPPRMLKEIRVHLNHSDLPEGPIITLCEVQVFSGTMCPKPPPFPRKGLYKFIPGSEGNWSCNFTLIIHCIEGYITDGPISVRCEDINRWNGTFGSCSVKRCTRPVPQVSHGFLVFHSGIEGNGTYNTIVSFNCIEGYKRDSIDQLRCAEEDQWHGNLGFCLVKRCSQPVRQVAHGILTFKNGIAGKGTYNTTVTLNCNEGYKRSKAGQMRCVDEEQWMGTTGHCKVKRCDNPLSPIAHGVPTFKDGLEGNGTYNTTASLNCTEGYKLDSHAQLLCAGDEQWLGTLGRCLVKRCDNPLSPIAHGVPTFKDGLERNGTYNTTVSLNCTEGYKLDSHAQLLCAGEEQWLGTLGRCLVKRCDNPLSPIAHGVLTFKDGLEGNGTYNTTVSLNCTEGYKLDSHTQLRCAGDEQWQGTLGRCLVKRCDKPLSLIAHGVLTFKDGLEGNGTYNTTVSLNCTEGYKLDSHTQLRCAGNEQWLGTLGRCLVKRCDEPPSLIAHFIVTFKDGLEGNRTYNTTVSLNCTEGYKPDSHAQLRCAGDEKWQGTLERCLVIDCGQPRNIPDNSTITSSSGLAGNTSYNTTLTIECNNGFKYTLPGNKTIRCGKGGHWTGNLGQCGVIDCGRPLHIPGNSTAVSSTGLAGNTSYNATFTIHCNKGFNYTLPGNDSIVCGIEGHWMGILGLCEVIDCGRPLNIPGNSTIVFTSGLAGNTSYNATFTIHCKEGFRYTHPGNKTIRCGNEGHWTGYLGLCEVTRCTEIVQPEYGVIVVEPGTDGRWSFNTTVAIICNTGYSLNGETLIKCLETGRWTGALGYCLAHQDKNADEEEKTTSVLGWVITGPLCLILLLTNIATCLRFRRHQNSDMQTLKNKSNESENNAMEPYDNLQMEERAKSEYDQLTFERESSLTTTMKNKI